MHMWARYTPRAAASGSFGQQVMVSAVFRTPWTYHRDQGIDEQLKYGMVWYGKGKFTTAITPT